LFLSCTGQWIRLRDGDSTASNLLAHLEGTPDSTDPIISTGPNLLVEFFSDIAALSNGDCFGGFFVQINRIEGQSNKSYCLYIKKNKMYIFLQAPIIGRYQTQVMLISQITLCI